MAEPRRRSVLVVGPSTLSRARAVASMLQDHLSVVAATGAAALAELANLPDIVLLDPRLPDFPGDDLLVAIRQRSSVPVIVLSDDRDEERVLRALRLGADDVLSAPFGQRELCARVDAAIRRAEGSFGQRREIQHGDLRIDLASRDVQIRGVHIELTAKEFDLLAFLAAAPGVVFTRRQLLHGVWDSSPDWQGAATVTEHIRRLRKAIELDPKDPRYLRTVRSVGYRFEHSADVRAA